MSNFKRLAAVLALLSGLAVFSYGETYYSFSVGVLRLSEIFTKEDYGRTLTGANISFAFLYAPEESPWGVFSQTSLFTPSLTTEWKGTQMNTLDYSEAWDLRISAAPAYTFRLGKKTKIPVSCGPVLIVDWDNYWDEQTSTNKYYEAWGMGMLLDGSFIISPEKRFFIRSGISYGFDFLHTERGKQKSKYRAASGVRLAAVPYVASSLSVFLGIGLSFD